MKVLDKLLNVVIIYIMIINISPNNVYASTKVGERNQVKVAVFLYDFNDQFISLVKQNLEEIQKENPNKVDFSFFDAKGNQAIQNESINKALTENFNLFIINFVITKPNVMEDIVNQIKQKNIPLILYTEPEGDITKLTKDTRKAIFIASNIEQSGILQGKILVDKWNTDKESIDKNGDNIMQYAMLSGKLDSPVANARTKYSISTINNAGIKTEKIVSINCDWKQDLARSAIESVLLSSGNKIEAIIANNDAMAIGAIEALQKYGYNKGDKSKTIAVVGIDAIPAARDLIQKGFMTGTVVQDPRATAEAIYTVGMNLVNNLEPLENTNYTFDNTGVVIRLPYHEYKP